MGFPPPLTRWFTVQLQIEEISRKLRTGDLGIPLNPEERFERNLHTKNEYYISTEHTTARNTGALKDISVAQVQLVWEYRFENVGLD